MNPHFLFNALNTLAALSRIAPREVPPAVGRLRHFLRASFDQHERALVPLEEELAIVRMYLDIEMLRFGSRLKGLFGRSFQLEVRSEVGQGTTVTMRIPFRKQFEVGLESPGAVTSGLRELASR